MSLVKALLLENIPTDHVHANRQPSSQPPSPQLSPTNNAERIQTERSITPPTTICFQPTKRPLSQLPVRCSNYLPTKPSSLTIYTHCQTTIPPTQPASPSPKRRKISIPPSVDYYASTNKQSNNLCTSQPNTLTSPPAPTTTITCAPTPIIKKSPALSPLNAWIYCYCRKSGRQFYLNTNSLATQMTKPAGFVRNPVDGADKMAGFLPYETIYPGHELIGSKRLCSKYAT